jgi:succinate-semialdehyde dehydrogenase/glutarate-semialdehyde dehydrogenase
MIANLGLLRTDAYVNGEWVSGDKRFPVTDPATGEVLAEVPRMGRAATAHAIECAQRALPAWRARSAGDRSQVLRRWAALVREYADDIATILTSEQGKPVGEARGEVLYAAAFLEWFAEEGRRVYGDVIPSNSAAERIIVLKQPIGVVAGITPWNLPAVMITRKAAPALAAGCTLVLKPAEQTPLTALALCELADRAGVPAGVLNVVTGSAEDAPEIGRELTGNPVVRKLSFTGSTDVGRLLMRQCADGIKKVSLELGGNAAFIVYDDADVDLAVEGIVSAKFRNAGQICTAANRILVQDGIRERFTEALVRRSESVVVGSGFEQGVEMGPLIDDNGLRKVEKHLADLVERGGSVLAGGGVHSRGGTFFTPTVVSGLSPDALVWHEETFGPIAAITGFSDEDEAIAMANDSEYGLVSYVYGQHLGRIWRTAEAIETGMVAVNTGRVSNEMAPFGGIKESGIGREGSRYGLEEWLELKYVNLAGLGR